MTTFAAGQVPLAVAVGIEGSFSMAGNGLAVALDAVQSAKGRRALVLLSDGTDRYSRTRATTLADAARRKDVLIVTVNRPDLRIRARDGYFAR